MAVDERRAFLERHFGDDVARRRIGSFRRWLVQGMIRLGQQIVYLGYYGDPASWAATGYVPFSRRPEGLRAKRKEPGTLVVEDGRNVTGDLDAEVVIVGSGAAGAVIGYRLAEQGHRVLICERGHHVDPAVLQRGRGGDAEQPLPRRGPADRPRLQAPGAPGDVRRRDDGDQQRGLDRAARRGAGRVGPAAR